MMKMYKPLTLFVLFALLVLPSSPAYAQGTGTEDGKVIFGSNFTLESGDTFNGDLVVFGGNVTVEDDAKLNGNLVVFGGTISNDGNVSGDVVIIGGQVQLEEHAVVEGDLVTIGGQVERAEGAVVKGDVINNTPPDVENPSGAGHIPPEIFTPDAPRPNFDFNFNPFVQFFQVFSWAVVMAAFAMVLMLFWQAPLERAGSTIVRQPLMSGAIGLVATLVAGLLFLTIVPPIVVAFAWLFGIVAMGRELGERFATAINQRWTPVIHAGSGTFLLVAVGGALGTIPCLGGLMLIALGLLGIGGAISIWFNLQPALRASLPAFTPPADTGESPPTS